MSFLAATLLALEVNPVARPDAGPVHSIFSRTKTVFLNFEGAQELIPRGGYDNPIPT